MSRWLWIPLALVAMGCDGGGDDDDDTDVGIQPCGSADPVVEEITVQTFSYVFSEGEDPLPAIAVMARTTDDDGDLHSYTMRMWWDDTIDGRVLTEEEFSETYGDVPDTTRCETNEVGFTQVLALNGAAVAPPFDTTVELGVVVIDAAGNESAGGETTVHEFTVPAEDDATAWELYDPDGGDE